MEGSFLRILAVPDRPLYDKKMLSYRHGFHAGSAADALKHSVLLFCLDYLTRKGKPCLYVDTHGGAGSYPLAGGFAAQSREWEGGVGRLVRAAGEGPLPALLNRYLELAGDALPEGAGNTRRGPRDYPGSPALMAKFLRPGDRLVCFELHPGDFASLSAFLAPRPRTEVRREDGFRGLLSLLPPPSRRACILIDPSYEIKEDFNVLPGLMRGALKRFPQGLYIVWYPLLTGGKGSAGGIPGEFAGELMDLYRGNRCRIELHTAKKELPPANSPRGMYGSGLVVYNPPWTLREALENALPFMAEILGNPGAWQLHWENALRTAAEADASADQVLPQPGGPRGVI